MSDNDQTALASAPQRMIDIPFVVQPHEHGARVDMFISKRIRRMSRSLIVRVIRSGHVRREPGGTVIDKPSNRVFEGETIIMRRKPLNEGPTEGIEIPVLFADDHVVAVSKPGDLVVHPTASAYHRTLIRIMRERLKDPNLDLAHRIDKETSGLVLMGRDGASSSNLTQQFARREVEKAYLAVVDGVPDFDVWTVEEPLRLVPDSLTSCLMEVGGEGAQPATTTFTVLSRGENAALVRAEPKTGRQHQIRVHLLHLGHRILGDKLYSVDEAYFIEAVGRRITPEDLTLQIGHARQALHNYSVTFRHPGLDTRMTILAPPPPDMLSLFENLGIEWPAGRPTPRLAKTSAVESFVQEFADAHDVPESLASLVSLRGPAKGPRLCLDDVSAIPFLVDIPGVELYQHRARVRASDGDLFAAVTPTVAGYEDYCRDVLGFGSAKFVRAEAVDGALAVARACRHGDAFSTIVDAAKAAGALTIFPYMGIEAVWDLARAVEEAAEVDVSVLAPTPAATWIANDKASLSAVVRGVLSDDYLVETYEGRDAASLAEHLGVLAAKHDRVGLKRTRCASAMGNRVYEGNVLRSMAPGDREALVRRFFAETECAPNEVVLAVAWLATECSPSTQLTIPAEGEPVVDGVYEQILAGDTRVFVGSRPSRLGTAVDRMLSEASLMVARAFQRFGYVGCCSFDFLVVDPAGDFSVHFTECNGRWGGTSTPMHMVDRLVGRPRPTYRAQDFVHPELVGATFSEVIAALGEDLFDPKTKKGRFVLYNVGPLRGSGKLDVIALGESDEHADELMLDVLPRRLGLS